MLFALIKSIFGRFSIAVPLFMAFFISFTACTGKEYMGRSYGSWRYDLDAKTNDAKRKEACRAMPAFAEDALEAIPRMVELLDDDNEGVQEFCREGLEKIGPLAVPALEEVMTKRSPVVKMHAAWAILKINPEHEKAATVMAKAVSAVGDTTLSDRAQDAVIHLGEAAVRLLTPLLSDPYPPVQLQAIATLSKMREKARGAVDALHKTISDKNEDVRVKAIMAISAVGERATVEPILNALLEDKMERVADVAGAMLMYIGAREGATGYDDPEEAAAKIKKGVRGKK